MALKSPNGQCGWTVRGISCSLAVLILLTACSRDREEISPSSTSSGSPTASSLPSPHSTELLPARHGEGEQSLGYPLASVVVLTSAFTKRSDGTPLTVVLAPGIPARLSIMDSRSGQLLDTHDISGGKESLVNSGALATATDSGNVFIGLRDGRAFSYDPDARRLQKLPPAPGMEDASFWDAEPMDDGTIAFSTYPTARLLTYDDDKQSWRDFGRMGLGNQYTLGMSSRGSTTYVGTGTESPEVWSVDRRSGESRRIALPQMQDGESRDFAMDLQVSGDSLYVRVDGEKRIYRLHLKSGTWGERIENAARGLAKSVNGSPAGIYWTGTDGVMRFHNNATKTDTVLPREDQVGAIRGFGWQDLDGDGEPESLLTVTAGVAIQAWNAQTRTASTAPGRARPAPSLIRTLGVAPDGSLLAAAYGTAPYFVALPHGSRSFSQIHLRGQIESFGTADDALFAGVYPGARIFETSTSADGGQSASPRWNVGMNQDRPLAIEDLQNGMIAVASMPKFGKIGGAVTLFNQETGSGATVKDATPGRTPLALTHRGPILYVGTGATGGLGTNLADGGATIVMIDIRTRKVVKTRVPSARDASLSALMFDRQGRLWAWGVDTLFELDPETLSVRRSKRYSEAQDDDPYAKGRGLVDGGPILYGSARGKVFSIDKSDLSRSVFAQGNNLVRGGDGLLYYSRGSTLFRWLPGSSR